MSRSISFPFRIPSTCASLAFAALAQGQLAPDRVYYGIGRSIPMTVRVPEDLKGEAEIRLLAPVTAESKASAAVVAGRVDLAGLFPILWKPPVPPVQDTVYYAQLVVGEQKVGPAVVLQPLLDPPYCVFFDGQSGEPKYRDSRGTYSGLRAYIDRHVLMETSLGNIELAMRPDQAPNTVWAFLDLCGGGFYTDVMFHRVKAAHPNGAPFVIQAGDPIQGHGEVPGAEGGPGFLVNLEKSKLPHDFGVISLARYDTPSLRLPNSGGSQFFICLSREGTSFLDGQFTSFGNAVAGADTIRAIAAVEVGERDRPTDPPVIKRCRLIDAPPYGEGPKPISQTTPVAR
jgi:cyclophilin family peptidyl-prolyl cis-trans isomerase